MSQRSVLCAVVGIEQLSGESVDNSANGHTDFRAVGWFEQRCGRRADNVTVVGVDFY